MQLTCSTICSICMYVECNRIVLVQFERYSAAKPWQLAGASYATESYSVLEPQHQENAGIYAAQERRVAGFEAPKL